MTKKYKVEPPELVRQMWKAGLNVHADDARGVARVYGPQSKFGNELVDRLDCPPSWLKELKPEKIPAERVKEGAPVEVSWDLSKWHKAHFAMPKDNSITIYVFNEGRTKFSSDGEIDLWDHWRIPANMDQEEWKREWLVPEKKKFPTCGPEDGMDCPKCEGTGEVEVREGSSTMMEFCPECHGGMIVAKGNGVYSDCHKCNGTGEANHGK